MKTKTVTYYIDLYPGWQDSNYEPYPVTTPGAELSNGYRRVKVLVALPCFGGSAVITDVVRAPVEEVGSDD